MKRVYFLCFFFLSDFICYAQNNLKIQYALHYVVDTSNLNQIKHEKFSLFISENNNSCFLSNVTIYNDSVLKSLEKVPLSLGIINNTKSLPFKNTGFDWIISKNRDLNKISIYDKIGKISGKYDFDIVLDWEILDSTRIIENYNCILAKTQYAGRNYYSWFCPELPISDGPYIFSGLPGLIMEISDTKMHYSFKILSIEKYSIPVLNPYFSESRATSFKRADFLNMRKQRQKDPINYIENSLNIKSLDLSTKEQIIKNMARKNNYIEMDW